MESINIDTNVEAAEILAANYRVYTNYDLSQVTNFTQYGSLVKRFSTSITKIINFFPAGLEVPPQTDKFINQETAFNIIYDSVEDDTTLDIHLSSIRNPFEIDFSINAEINMMFNENEVSPLRNMKLEYKKYVLFVNGQQYPLNYLYPTDSDSTSLKIIVDGNPFSGNQITYDYLVIRPNDFEVNKVFNLNFDAVENFLLNRKITPVYTAKFVVPKELEDGTFAISSEYATFTLETRGHKRQIRSFSVILGDVEKIEIGLVRTNHFVKKLRKGDHKGVGTERYSFCLDCSQGGLLYEGSFTKLDGLSTEKGTLVRCENKGEKWLVNGQVVASSIALEDSFHLPPDLQQYSLVPAFSGNGSLQVCEVELDPMTSDHKTTISQAHL